MHVEEIDPLYVRQRLAQKPDGFVLLDCRDASELQTAEISGAMHIPMSEIQQRCGELNRAAEIVVFCHKGVRSYNVASYLKHLGFANVRSMRGGIQAWAREVDPNVQKG